MQITNIVFRPPTSPVLAPSLQAALRAGLARDDLGALRRRAGSPRRAEGQRLMKQPWQAPLRQRQCLAFGFDLFASLTQAKVRNSPKLKIDYPIDLGAKSELVPNGPSERPQRKAGVGE